MRSVMSFVENLKAEVARLEAELASNPLFMQLQSAKSLLVTYTVGTGTEQSAPVAVTSQPTRKPDSPRSSMLEATKEYIAGRSYPTPTTEILEAITAQGIVVRGKVPRNSLSSSLSRSEEFKAHGRSGWTLVVPGDDDGTKELADDISVAGCASSAYVIRG